MRWVDGRRHRGGGQRGAVAPEYAIGIALLVVAALGTLGALEDEASDHLNEQGASLGAPDLPDLGVSTTTATTTGSGSGGTTTTAPANVTANATIVSTNKGGKNKQPWDPTVNLSITNASGNAPLANATVTVRWTQQPSGTVTQQTFTTTSQGTANFGLSNLEGDPAKPGYVSSVTFEVISITGSNPTIDYTPSTPLTVTLVDE